MALSVLAEENEKLNHKRPELQLVQWGWGRGVWHGVELAQCRGQWSQKSSSKEWTPKLPKQGQVRENTQKNQCLLTGEGVGPNQHRRYRS